MNVLRNAGAASIVMLAFALGACSSSSSGPHGHDGGADGSTTGNDGGLAGDGGAGGPVSTCAVSDEGDGCHDTSCPCTLLTADDINSAVGVMVGPPDHGTGMGGDPHTCIWTYKAAAPSTDKLTVYLTTNIEPPAFAETCGRNPSPGITVTRTSGVGDTACYTVLAQGFGTDLTFQKNCWGYDISISASGTLKSMFTSDMIEAAEKTLALDVASKY